MKAAKQQLLLLRRAPRVEPGEGVRHRWDIDEDGEHHAGLDWYHPHIHGSTAIQVASGATGAWIVRGPVDELPGIKDARERVIVFTTPPIGYTPLADGQKCDEDHLTFNEFEILGTTSEKQTNLINGVRRPRMVMAPGQIERWRLLHGSFLDEVFLVAFHGKDSECKALDLTQPPINLTQIGRDGLVLPRPASGADWPFAPPYIFMSPGYRVEALLDGAFHVSTQGLEISPGLCTRRDQVGHAAMARHDVLRRELLQRRECVQPCPCAADGKHGEQAVHVDDVAGKGHLRLRQQHHHVAWRVAAATMAELEHRTAERQSSIRAFDQARRQCRHRIVSRRSQQAAQRRQLIATARTHVRNSRRMGNELGGLAKDLRQRWINLVSILHAQGVPGQRSLAAAFQHLVDIHNADVQEFDQVAAALPSWGKELDAQIGHWVRALRYNVYGFTLWESVAERYQEQKAVLGTLPLVAPVLAAGVSAKVG